MEIISAKTYESIKIEGVGHREGNRQIMRIITDQHVNGMWKGEDIFKALYNQKQCSYIKSVFEHVVSLEIMITLAVVKYIELFEKDSKKMTLIIRKAKEYIDGSSSMSYDKLASIWSEKIK